MNHEKLNRMKSSVASAYLAKKPSPREAGAVTFGRYKYTGKTVAQLMRENPGYVFWGVRERAFEGWAAADAEKYTARFRQIKPPVSRPSFYAFECKCEGRSLVDFELVLRSAPSSSSKKVTRQKHLDLSVLGMMDKSHNDKIEILMGKLCMLIFGKPDPSKWEWKEWLEDDHNFALDCRENHFPNLRAQPGVKP